MTQDHRRYPRIDFEGNGELVLPSEAVVPVAIRCLSCEGAGIEVPADTPIHPSEVVNLRLELPHGRVELSARVAWTAGTRAGLRLRLSQTEADAKRAFGAWIAPRTKERIAQARAQQ